MKNDNSNGRTKMHRKKRNIQYLFVSILVPLIFGIVILSIEIISPLVIEKEYKPKIAKAKEESVSQIQSASATTSKNEYKAKYQQIVDSIKQKDHNNPNVIASFVNDWQPIGTTQTEPHTVKYSHHSNDFYEMEDAAAYATELTKQDFSIRHLSKGFDDESVKVYIATNDKQYHYVVYLHWEINKGWLPFLVQQVKELKVS
ncbi:YrrS family protein [Bacillus sp. RG28]|uniref:YrrS family protein n=1 Tax=Gottfriedia endophytica TaxID=2820819 RepID=A0A940SIG6_9BACI|nr:YrrS family protein [Gottfriedia endophytica]MBP0723784.1 YrrS family protein [Gottfriedia endophytica]